MRLSRCATSGALGALLSLLAFTGAHGQPSVDQKKERLRFRLSDAVREASARPRPAQAQATPLGEAEAEKILRRLPALAPDESTTFALREKSLPPPRAGSVVQGTFPPKGHARLPLASAPAPLRILRHGPEGRVSVARRLSVTFSAPMVPVTSSEDLVRQAVPVRLTPEPPGRWRWVGAQTLLFEPAGRFPMATDYEVEIPSGTRAHNGAALAESTRWSFATPPPSVVSLHPEEGNHPIGRDPLFFVGFDQKVDSQAVLATIGLRAGDWTTRLRLATAHEIDGDADVKKNHVQETQAGHWLAFRAQEPLPLGAAVTLTIGPGTPSAEGPTATSEPRVWRLRTYSPLRVIGQACSGKSCPPGHTWTVLLSNPIDAKAFRKEMVRVGPPLLEMKVAVYGSSVQVSGRSVGGQAYRVTLSGEVPDTFGLTLERDETITFDVSASVVARDLSPRLWARSSGFAVLDPTGPPRFPVYSQHLPLLRVQAYSVVPEDFTAFQLAKAQPIGRRLFSRDIPIENPQFASMTSVDLEPALADGLGQVVLIVEPDVQPADPSKRMSVRAWVQATRLSLEAFSDDRALFASVSSLSDGAPIAGAEVQLMPGGPKAATGADGLATLALNTPSGLLVARRGNDVAFLPAAPTDPWQRRPAAPTLRWYVFDGRGLYRPGDEVKVKGWLRLVGSGAKGDVTLPSGVARQVRYVLEDAEDNEVAKGTAALNAMGSFDLSLRLPPTINLGETKLSFEVDAQGVEGLTHQHAIGVLEFRRPEFEVAASASEGPFMVGDSASLSVSASYFTGGALPDAEVRWDVEASPGSYRPPNRDDYVFGTWTPWWEPRSDQSASGGSRDHEGRTDSMGRHRLRIDFESADPPQPMNLHAEATVEDVNRQELTARADLLVHPADVYVGVKSARLFVWRDSPVNIDTIVTDLDGASVPGRPVEVRAEGLDWEQEAGQWTEKVIDLHECALESKQDPVRCTFTAKAGGRYRVTATVTDRRGRKNRTVTSLWAGGFEAYGGRAEADVTLIPDKTEYRPGETAEILVMAPFAPAEGVLTLRRSGILRAERFRMSERSHTLRVAIDEAWTPNVHAHVDLKGATPASLRRTASATLELPVPPLHRRLSLKVEPRETSLAPGGTTLLDAQLLDANAKPVAGGELAVVVVDEAVLSLLGSPGLDAELDDESDVSALAVLADPMRAFYMPRDAGARHDDLRASVLAPPVAARPSSFGSGAQTSGSITHEPVGCLVAGQFPLIGAAIDPPASVASARVYYKSALGSDYYFVEMTPVGGEFVGKLPKPRLEASPITYYITSMLTDGSPSQTAEVEVRVVADEAECPAGLRVAEIGPPGAVSVFSATTAAVAVPVGFAAAGMVESIPLRADFNALALFAASVRTDAQGRASVPLKLPDSLTRYRIRAVAAEGSRFGRAESTITARLPLMVRQSPPRFLNFGDRFELPVVIQNQTGAPLPVDVAVRARNADLLQGNGRRVTVPANDRVEVRFPMAARRPGAARLQVGAASGALADANELRLPVWVPATTEAFATYGQIDHGAIAQPVGVPAGVVPEFGGLEITTSSTALQALTDAVLYLVAYRYECSEQLASRVLAVAALRDVLSAFRAEGLPKPDEMVAAVKRDIQLLQQRLREDGGFGVWRREEDEPWPYASIHVAHALERARAKGFEVPKEMLERSHGYLKDIESHIPSRYGPHARRCIVAYALYVRKLMGDRDAGRARALLAETPFDGLPLEIVGWLLPVLSGDAASAAEVAAIRRQLTNRVSESAASAHFTTFYGDDAYLVLYSDRRADALLLEGLIGDQPASDLIPKLVEGLLGHRKAGRWTNTQECAFVLLALDRYFDAYEKATPDFLARAWLGPRYAGEQRFKGRSKDRQHVEIPMRSLVEAQAATDLVLEKSGKGRLYYRIGLKYAPLSLRLEPADFGFSVERSYEPIDDEDDVRRDAEGAWHVKPGARVRVRVRMATPDVRHHVALVDPLPAGLEPLIPELATTATIPEDGQEEDPPGGWARWLWRWFEHQNMRDDRVEVFTAYLLGGVYDYTYVARATTPGDFVVPPPRAEEMYHPETFGRGRTDRVIVK